MKLTAQRLLTLLFLILLSIGFGFGFDAIATTIEKKNHPRPQSIAAMVTANSKEFGVPEAIIWATVKHESDFASNAVSPTGEIGLMQISPAQSVMICKDLLQTDPLDAGMLYDPATNLRLGTAYLSWLYQRYGVWENVYAAYFAGTEAVDAWLKDPSYLTPQGVLTNLPDRDAASYLKKTKKSVALYGKLYYES